MHTLRRDGFTLIEVIIVIVILGVLATLALPKIVGNIETARAAEAMNYFSTIKRAVADCISITNDPASCDNNFELGMAAPSLNSSFIYHGLYELGLLKFRAVSKNAVGRALCMEISTLIGGDGTAEITDVQFSADGPGSPYTSVVNRTGAGGAGQCNVDLAAPW